MGLWQLWASFCVLLSASYLSMPFSHDLEDNLRLHDLMTGISMTCCVIIFSFCRPKEHLWVIAWQRWLEMANRFCLRMECLIWPQKSQCCSIESLPQLWTMQAHPPSPSEPSTKASNVSKSEYAWFQCSCEFLVYFGHTLMQFCSVCTSHSGLGKSTVYKSSTSQPHHISSNCISLRIEYCWARQFEPVLSPSSLGIVLLVSYYSVVEVLVTCNFRYIMTTCSHYWGSTRTLVHLQRGLAMY